MAGLNAERRERGEEALAFGIALHAGEVMYGNIGAADRLDFTVDRARRSTSHRGSSGCAAAWTTISCSPTASPAAATPGRCARSAAIACDGVARPVEVFTLPAAA